MSSFHDQLVDLIAQESGLDGAALATSKGLMSSGILDSFALVTVVTFVEEHLGGEVPPADLTFANFDTIAAICTYVERVGAG
jgi:acyl carrier protein